MLTFMRVVVVLGVFAIIGVVGVVGFDFVGVHRHRSVSMPLMLWPSSLLLVLNLCDHMISVVQPVIGNHSNGFHLYQMSPF